MTRRRELLAALGTGLAPALAGCGYAPGGGDVRDRRKLGTAVRGDVRYDPDGSRFALSYQTTTVDLDEHDGGLFEVGSGTEIAVGDVTDGIRWATTVERDARDVALGSDAYVLDGEGSVITARPDPADAGEAGERGAGEREGSVAWTVSLAAPEPPLVADDRGAYLPDGESVVALRAGEIAWRVELDGPVAALHAVAGRVVVAAGRDVVALDADGRERWRRSVGTVESTAVDDGRIATLASPPVGASVATVVDVETGARQGSVEVGGRPTGATLNADALYVHGFDALEAYDVASGERRWSRQVAERGANVVGAPEGAYRLDDCEVVALGNDGERRWRRTFDGHSCGVVGGWLADEALVVLLDSGELVRLHRRGVDRGLL